MNCSLEGQVANIADRIAVSSHDLEDGMRAGLFDAGHLKNISIFQDAQKRVQADKIEDRTVRRTRTAKAIIDKLVGECIEQSNRAIVQSGIKTLDDIYTRKESLIVLPGKSVAEILELEKFLLANFYNHPTLLSTAKQVEQWLKKLFEHFCKNPQLMPRYFQRFIKEHGLQRAVCDYIAGMTDRFTLKMLKEI
jgi:dGTPase